MSFRYLIHLNTGHVIRSGVIPDDLLTQTHDALVEFLGHPTNTSVFKPESKDGKVIGVLVPRNNVNYISFVKVK